MVGFIFILATLNLAVGYFAAVALGGPLNLGHWRLKLPALRLPKRKLKPAIDVAPKSAELGSSTAIVRDSDVAEPAAAAPAVAGLDELPADWLAQLAAEGVVAHSFVEGVAHAIRLDVGRYREQLVAAECRARSLAEENNGEGLERLASELLALDQEWLDKQTAAADMLGQRSGRLGDHEQAATALEQALLDQAAFIRASCTALAAFDVKDELEHKGKRLLERIAMLLVHAHALRDGILDLLATMMRAGNKLESFGASVERDALTKLPNRIGLETLLDAWWRDDPQRSRLLSAILIDVDRFGRLNQRLGTRCGDGAVVAVGGLIAESLGKDRGFERVVRIGGEAFFILQGDIGPHQALAAAERLRQAIEATTFDDESVEFDLTVSCGVIEVKHSESSLDLVRRARETLVFAKKAGRNRCALDKGDGPAMIDPPQFPVKARVVSLRAAVMDVVNN